MRYEGWPPCGWSMPGQPPFSTMPGGNHTIASTALPAAGPSKSEEKLKIRSQSKKKSEEKEVAARSGDRHTPGPFRPSEGGGSTSPETSEDESSVETSAIRLMLKRRVQQMERPKSSLGSVRIEEFAGERYKYTKWKKAVEAQRQLCRLEEQELAMLVYLSTKQEARDCVYQVPISEFTRAGGLRLIWRLLDEALGESEEEQFERAEKEYNQYRRLPGQPVSAYIGQMKRLKAQSQRVDPETQISDRAWGQRLLNRGSLSRRERLDVFFSAGGLYEPAAIERALRHRCANTHEDERRVPTPYVAQKKPASYCASCGQKGHWRGDPQCPNMLAGKDKPHQKKPHAMPAAMQCTSPTWSQRRRRPRRLRRRRGLLDL